MERVKGALRYAKCPICNDKIAIKSGDPYWRGSGVHFNGIKRCIGKYSIQISEYEFNFSPQSEDKNLPFQK